jgi:hypothetical protein
MTLAGIPLALVLAASYATCKSISVCAGTLKAASMRDAISDDVVTFPLRKFDKAGLPTPTSFAAAETDSLFGVNIVSRTY